MRDLQYPQRRPHFLTILVQKRPTSILKLFNVVKLSKLKKRICLSHVLSSIYDGVINSKPKQKDKMESKKKKKEADEEEELNKINDANDQE